MLIIRNLNLISIQSWTYLDCGYESYLPSLRVSVDSKLTCHDCMRADGHLYSNHVFFFIVG